MCILSFFGAYNVAEFWQSKVGIIYVSAYPRTYAYITMYTCSA